jgi:hypothetical protein
MDLWGLDLKGSFLEVFKNLTENMLKNLPIFDMSFLML